MKTTQTNSFIVNSNEPLNFERPSNFAGTTESMGFTKAVAVAFMALAFGGITTGQANYVGSQFTGTPNTLQIARGERKEDDDDDSLLLFAGLPWVTQDVLDYMLHHQDLSAASIDHLRDSLRAVFGDIEMGFETHVDPEEGWSKIVLNADTGIDDIEARMDKEDEFYRMVDQEQILKAALQHTIVSFS